MALPAIKPYPMPQAAELPANRVSWKLEPGRAALLIHDMQQYFVDAFTPEQSPVVELIAHIDALRSACRAAGIPIIYSAQPGGQKREDRGLQTDFWGPGMNDGPYQKRIIEAIAPEAGDIVLTKWRYNAFRRTNLLDILQEHDRDQLIVCGIYAHIGVLMTTCDAFMQDIEPFLVADAVADFTKEDHMMAVKYAATRCAVATTTASVLAAIDEALVRSESAAKSVQPAAGSSLLSMDTLRQHIADMLQESASDIQDTDDLINDWGMDSVRLMRLVEQWRRSGAEVSFAELAERPTLADWRSLLIAKQGLSMPNADYFLAGGR
ncbi:isochorismatase family protein [Paenibacillus xylaniclasticus]|uniref:isochorismatase family protein n=1 Tax=Paenibacillus xylaniclasticus TaxID=588083 RepID=UPI000FD7F1F3|nr:MULTISPECIES: isochorismatase family protein [Paenibacillus]GFN29833.1 isochorismatase [Paenibacillus curdlanolyticus]